MNDAPNTDPAAQAFAALGSAHADLTAASKRASGDDGRILFGAAAAVDVAGEYLTPPNIDRALAAQSCREALHLAKLTRAHGQGATGGNVPKLLDQARKKIEDALKILES